MFKERTLPTFLSIITLGAKFHKAFRDLSRSQIRYRSLEAVPLSSPIPESRIWIASTTVSYPVVFVLSGLISFYTPAGERGQLWTALHTKDSEDVEKGRFHL